jgi:phosphate uptake regulator
MRDILSVFDGEGKELIEDVGEREADVDAMLYLVERQVRVALDSHLVASSLKVNRHQALEYSNLARSLERMMDHAFQIGAYLLEFEMPNLSPDSAPLCAIPQWLEALKELMINIRTKQSLRIESARNELKQAQQLLESHEEILMRSDKKAATILFEFKLSESLRRQCAYARDFGEILLNLKVNDEMFSGRMNEE